MRLRRHIRGDVMPATRNILFAKDAFGLSHFLSAKLKAAIVSFAPGRVIMVFSFFEGDNP
jgi:hypothetical protein